MNAIMLYQFLKYLCMSITMYIFTAISDANYADSRLDSSSTDIAGRGNKGRDDVWSISHQ
jgi:hypothetical protein